MRRRLLFDVKFLINAYCRLWVGLVSSKGSWLETDGWWWLMGEDAAQQNCCSDIALSGFHFSFLFQINNRTHLNSWQSTFQESNNIIDVFRVFVRPFVRTKIYQKYAIQVTSNFYFWSLPTLKGQNYSSIFNWTIAETRSMFIWCKLCKAQPRKRGALAPRISSEPKRALIILISREINDNK